VDTEVPIADAEVTVAIISAVSGLAVAAVGAVVRGALAQRAGTDEELRKVRTEVYPWIWERTSIIPRWPRPELSYQQLRTFDDELRGWYFGQEEVLEDLRKTPGGLYLSENSRERYGELKDLIALTLVAAENEGAVPNPVCEHLLQACTALRNALTEDLDTRRKRSVWWSIERRRLHRRQKREAERRKQDVKALLKSESEARSGQRLDAPA
jgi:hypothetical protein